MWIKGSGNERRIIEFQRVAGLWRDKNAEGDIAMYNKGAKSSGKVVAPNKLWHAFKHKNFDVFKREFRVYCIGMLRDD